MIILRLEQIILIVLYGSINLHSAKLLHLSVKPLHRGKIFSHQMYLFLSKIFFYLRWSYVSMSWLQLGCLECCLWLISLLSKLVAVIFFCQMLSLALISVQNSLTCLVQLRWWPFSRLSRSTMSGFLILIERCFWHLLILEYVLLYLYLMISY